MNGDDPADALAKSGEAADATFSSDAPSPTVQHCQPLTWFEIQLVDSEGNPVPGERYELTLPDGTVREGTLDREGVAGVEGIDPGQCTLTFPDLEDDDWDGASGDMSFTA